MFPLIIGCGNPDRGEDAAGVLVARLLRKESINTVEHDGDTLALLDLWEKSAEVFLIDAVMSGKPPGVVTVWSAEELPPEARFPSCSTHAFGLADAIRLAWLLGRIPPRLTIYGIEVSRIGPGDPVSFEVSEAIRRTAKQILSRLSASGESQL